MAWSNYRSQGQSSYGYGKGFSGRRFQNQPYSSGKGAYMSTGYGKGASKGLADLLGQLQSEITAQHQLQAIAGVLLPGNQPTSQQAAPAPETTGPTGGELKEIRDLLLSLKEEKNVTASNETPMALTQTLAQIKAELKQMSGSCPTEDKTPFATELAALQAQVAEAAKRHRHANVSSSGPSQGNRMAKLRAQTVSEASTVTRAQHVGFYRDILGKRTSMKAESVDLQSWCQSQASKWTDDDFQQAVAKTAPKSVPDDAADEAIVQACFLSWVGRAGSTDSTH